LLTIAAASIWSSRALHDRADALLGRPRSLRGDGARGAREIEEVRALGLVELERPRQRLEHELGDAADLAALQPPVVVGADAGQGGDLLAAQPGHPAPAVARQAGLLGCDLRASGGEELGDVGGDVSLAGRSTECHEPSRYPVLACATNERTDHESCYVHS
jgi:hypothetical protein